MTSRETWKLCERKVAKALGGVRTPLSGGHSRHTRGDVIHKKFYVEFKYRAKWAIWELFNQTERLAKEENKLPLVVIKQKNQKGEIVCLRLEDFVKIIKEEYKQ